MARSKIVAVTVVLLGWLAAGDARAATHVVDDDRRQCPSAPFRTVSAALAVAGPNDRVNVCAGSYREQVEIEPDQPGVVVEATPRRSAVILAPARFSRLPRAMVVAAGRGSVVRGFRILGPLPPNPTCGDPFFTHDAGVQIGGPFVRIEDNEIDNIRDNCGRGDGISAGDAQDELRRGFSTGGAVISGNLIKNYFRNGIIVEAVYFPEFSVRVLGNEIAGAQTRPTVGILVAQEGIVEAQDNFIHSNREHGVALFGVFAASDVIRGNRIRGNGIGIEVGSIRDGGSTIEDNDVSASRSHGIVDGGHWVGGSVISDNVVRDNVGHGLLLESTNGLALGTVQGNQVLRNRLDGIRVGDGYGYVLSANTALDNRFFDCRDTSGPGGPGTAGTQNTWTANRGRTSSPPGLCLP